MNLKLFRRSNYDKTSEKKSWNNQDIADFYRAVDILRQAGLDTEVDSGATDEGDPWFVFIKPETGDVLAHFAQVDGQFIAVSSLNHEVYRGPNIRSIVDQMLDRYPALLPQQKAGGRLFLHPTAAISAFLAAAFILNVDGIKASNLTEIIVSVAKSNLEYGSQGVSISPVALKSESLKIMFSDLNSTNFNVAVLGAALILH